MALIDDLRDKTYKETVALLEKYGKGCIVRPTGFGKTGILTRLINDYTAGNRGKETRVLYLYPNEPIKNAVLNFYYKSKGMRIPTSREIPGVQFITYTKLARMDKPEDIEGFDSVKLFMSDECHKLGGTKISNNMNKFRNKYKDVKYVGATATPDRMDLFDEVYEFFDDKVVSSYTLHDAFVDGVLQRPYYCFCSYSLEDDSKYLEKRVKDEFKYVDGNCVSEYKELMEATAIQMAELHNMPKIIKDVCSKCIEPNSYMRGVVFFADYNHINAKEKVVVNWFKDAFPDYKVNVIRVTGQNRKTRENAQILDYLVPKDKTIDLITSVDMLNMGYHVDNLKFVGMYRGTQSGVVYAQQLGRILNSGSMEQGVVFDWVDNIHRESMYDVLGRESKKVTKAKEKYAELKGKLSEAKGNVKVFSPEELKEYKILEGRFERPNNDWWDDSPNKLLPEDLIATSHEATYRELIAKTVAEPIAMRARQAWKNWLDAGGDIADGTAQGILDNALLPNLPLGPYCASKRLTIEKVLSIILGEGDYTGMVKNYTEKCKKQGIVW